MFRKVLINSALALLDKFLVDKITYAPLREFIQSMYDEIKQITELITDKNPEDKEQLEQFWIENRAEMLGDTIGTAIKIIAKEVHDEDVAQSLIDILREIDLEQKTILA